MRVNLNPPQFSFTKIIPIKKLTEFKEEYEIYHKKKDIEKKEKEERERKEREIAERIEQERVLEEERLEKEKVEAQQREELKAIENTDNAKELSHIAQPSNEIKKEEEGNKDGKKDEAIKEEAIKEVPIKERAIKEANIDSTEPKKEEAPQKIVEVQKDKESNRKKANSTSIEKVEQKGYTTEIHIPESNFIANFNKTHQLFFHPYPMLFHELMLIPTVEKKVCCYPYLNYSSLAKTNCEGNMQTNNCPIAHPLSNQEWSSIAEIFDCMNGLVYFQTLPLGLACSPPFAVNIITIHPMPNSYLNSWSNELPIELSIPYQISSVESINLTQKRKKKKRRLHN